MRYVKIDLSFSDKLRLLFLGVIPENKLPEVVRLVDERRFEKRVQDPQPVHKESINTNEDEEFHVPFFELNDDDVKTNL